MENFELIDDYLANRLNEQDKQAFENQLKGDPSLKKEVEFQQEIVQVVRHARTMQLKNMLNNVPLGGSVWTAGKIASAVVSAGVVATIMYLYINDGSGTTATSSQLPLTEEIASLQDATKEEEPIIGSTSTLKDSSSVNTAETLKEKNKDKAIKSTGKKEKETTPVRKPDLQVVDPSDEITTTENIKESSTSSGRGEISVSKMEVITSSADKKHNFHYQFVKGKLMLFGPFDKSLYEILEIHGDGHAVFLVYRENYYLLDESQSTTTELQAIRDGQLLKKLREYHGRD